MKNLTKIVDIENIKNFLFAGNAIITLRSRKTNKHLTFKVKASKKDEADSVFFVSVLSGPDNTSNYSYIGIIGSDKKTFKITQKSKVSSDAVSYQAFSFFLKNIINNKLHADLEVYHSGRCGRCGKLLTDPDSIKRGLGPHCSTKNK